MKKNLLKALLITSVIAMLTACGSKKDSSKTDDKPSAKTESSKEGDTDNKGGTSDEPKMPGYYIQTVDISGGSKSDENFGLRFTSGNFDELDLSLCMMYVASTERVLDVSDYDSTPTLNRYINDTTDIIHPGRNIEVMLYDDRLSKVLSGDDYERYENFAHLTICNFSDADLTVKECYDKKWVYMETYPGAVTSNTLEWDGDEGLYNLMINEAGAPDSLIASSISGGSDTGDIEIKDSSEIAYALFHEGAPVIDEDDDYKINITFYYMSYNFGDSVFSLLVEDMNKGKNYGYNCSLEINNVYLFTKECYEEFKTSREDDKYYFISYDEMMDATSK